MASNLSYLGNYFSKMFKNVSSKSNADPVVFRVYFCSFTEVFGTCTKTFLFIYRSDNK
jgi:hypothetical protein